MADQSLMFYQESPDFKRNQELARALREQAAAQPVTSTLGGLAKMGSMWASGWMEGEAKRREEARKQEFNDTLARALQTAKPWTNPDTGAPDIDAAQTRMSHELASSETTAPLAAQLQFGRLQNQQDMADKLALEREKAKLQPPEAPTTKTIYRDGREQVVEWNPETRTWNDIGGTKTDVLSPEAEGQKARMAAAAARVAAEYGGKTVNVLTPSGKTVAGVEKGGKIYTQNAEGTWTPAPVGSALASPVSAKGEGPLSAAAKLVADFNAGRLDKGQFDTAWAKMGGGLDLETNPDGTVRLSTSGAGALTKSQAGQEAQKLRDAERAARVAVGEVRRIKEVMADPDTLYGLLATGAMQLDSVVDQVREFAKVMRGTEEKDVLNFTQNELETIFRGTRLEEKASKSAAFRANIVRLAYSAARAMNGGGNLSKADVQAVMDGLGSGSPAQVAASLGEMELAVKRAYEVERRVRQGDDYTPTDAAFWGVGSTGAGPSGGPSPRVLRFDAQGNMIR